MKKVITTREFPTKAMKLIADKTAIKTVEVASDLKFSDMRFHSRTQAKDHSFFFLSLNFD